MKIDDFEGASRSPSKLANNRGRVYAVDVRLLPVKTRIRD